MKPIALVVHHTVTRNNISAESLRAIFKERFGVNYIGYHYVIRGDGSILKDLQDDQIGIHNNLGKYNNTNSLGIALAGDFTNSIPTNEQYAKLESLIQELRDKFSIPRENIFGHRDFKATACPSDVVYKWITNYKNNKNDMANSIQVVPQTNDNLLEDNNGNIWIVTSTNKHHITDDETLSIFGGKKLINNNYSEEDKKRELNKSEGQALKWSQIKEIDNIKAQLNAQVEKYKIEANLSNESAIKWERRFNENAEEYETLRDSYNATSKAYDEHLANARLEIENLQKRLLLLSNQLENYRAEARSNEDLINRFETIMANEPLLNRLKYAWSIITKKKISR